MTRHILSLCDKTGNWPRPYAETPGYAVHTIDLQHWQDVRTMELPDYPIYGVLAAPPCTAFAVSGAQYWTAKDNQGETAAALDIVSACMRIILAAKPVFWALENPIGRLRRYIGPPTYSFNPCDFAGYGDERDRYTKKTLLWGNFNAPHRLPAPPVRACEAGSWIMQLGGKSQRTKDARSATPLGFARAFFAANP